MSSGPSKVIVLDPDPRAGRLVQLGFEREGIPVLVPPVAAEGTSGALEIPETPGLVLVGGTNGTAVDLVRRAKTWLTAHGVDVPIVFAGRGLSRPELEAAGADEAITRPVFLRDIVTIGRLLRGVPREQRDHLTGSLVETTGVLTLVRALSALGRSAVLTLIRGLRRGEVRFFHGEVTSAQVGLIHGQAAFHQLLLWTDARFDFAHEDIVRRQQIPLAPDELFADAEQFLEGVREHAGPLSPSTVLEQDVQRVGVLGKQIPTEVHSVLRMFDGHRVLADVLEDSPYRVFETLRVAQKAVEAGLLRHVSSQRPKATWRAVLAIEEWLVGTESRDAVAERIATLDSGPVKAPPKRKHKRKRRAKKKDSTPPTDLKSADIDWGALVPRELGAELGPLSGVVPAYEAHGEVVLPTRDKPREGLEALMDTAKRQRIFPTDIGLEPKVVVAAESADAGAESQAPQETLAETTAEPTAAVETTAAADTMAAADTNAAAGATAVSHAAHAEPVSDAEPATAPVPRRKRAQVERGEDVILESVPIENEPRNTARHTAPPPPAAAEPATAAEPVPQSPRLPGSTTDRHAAPPPVSASSASHVAASPDGPAQGAIDASPASETVDPAAAALVAVPTYVAPMKSDPAAAVTAIPPDAAVPRVIRPGATDASALVRELVADVVPPSEPAPDSAPTSTVADAPAVSPVVTAPPAPANASIDAAHATTPRVNAPIEPVFLSKSPASDADAPSASVPAAPANPADMTHAFVPAPPPDAGDEALAAPATAAAPAPSPAAPTNGATPVATDDEPSDGVVRAAIASADTARVAPPRARPPTPQHDGPPVKEATGEIRTQSQAAKHPVVEEPSILVEDLAAKDPAAEQPSVLVADLAAAHDAVAAAVAKPPPEPPPGDAASPSRELEVHDVRRDALALSDVEEAFFRGAERTAPAPKIESFDDLDEGYEPPKFWDRVFGRKKPK